jgi:hypothetical protein
MRTGTVVEVGEPVTMNEARIAEPEFDNFLEYLLATAPEDVQYLTKDAIVHCLHRVRNAV